jgi:hypothetical protein
MPYADVSYDKPVYNISEVRFESHVNYGLYQTHTNQNSFSEIYKTKFH